MLTTGLSKLKKQKSFLSLRTFVNLLSSGEYTIRLIILHTLTSYVRFVPLSSSVN
jgi:hypothetical protein